MDKPPKRIKLPSKTVVVPDYSREQDDLVAQLQALAKDLTNQLRSNLDDPKIGSYSLDSILKIGDALKRWEGTNPLQPKPPEANKPTVDVQALLKQALEQAK